MNESNLNDNSNYNGDTYHAKTNLNTAIENPQINLNSATGLNIQNSNNTDSNMNSDIYNNGGIFQNNVDYTNQVNNNLNSTYGENSSYNESNNGANTNYESNTASLNSNSYASGISDGSSYIADNKIEGQNVNNYAPTLEKKKKPKTGFEISKELKMMIIIIIVLVAFMMVTPYIYDYLKEFGLIITSG